MFAKRFTRIIFIIGFFINYCRFGFGQDNGSVTFPSSFRDNQTVRIEQQLSLPINSKRNDWWPPAAGASTTDQEVTQPSVYQYPPWIQQPPMPASYYSPGPALTGPVGQVRSEHYGYPPEYAEYGHSVIAPAGDNSLGLGPKHLAIVSFIGLLLLFAIIQNSLMSAKRKDALVDALSGRKKRDLYVTRGLRPMTPEQEEILNDDARLRCIQRTICLENRNLVENLGADGKKLARYLT